MFFCWGPFNRGYIALAMWATVGEQGPCRDTIVKLIYIFTSMVNLITTHREDWSQNRDGLALVYVPSSFWVFFFWLCHEAHQV